MSADRSMRNLFAVLLLVAAAFVAMNRVVSSAPLGDWWLPLLLLVVGAALIPNWKFSRRVPEPEAEPPAAPLPLGGHSPAAPVPRLHTMTIRPDPELEQYSVSTSDPAAGEVLPFMDAAAAAQTEEMPAVPSVPLEPEPISAPAVTPEPVPEVIPASPETPAPAAPVEPTIESPETPAPADTPTEVLEHGPSQMTPVSTTPEPSSPAPEPGFTARSEYVNPDEAVAQKEPPAAPHSTDAVTAPQRTEPEKDVVAEKTAAPQQSYEAEQIGTLTPEQMDSAMNGDSGSIPAMRESASPVLAAQELSGEGVGSADDLTKLNGIGAKSAAALRAAGIDSYQKLANSSGDTIREALATGGVRLVGDTETWAIQASYAARGDWQGLRQFNAERKTTTGD